MKMAARKAAETLRRAAVAGLRSRAALFPRASNRVPPLPALVHDEIVELAYELRDAPPSARLDVADGIYEPYDLWAIRIPDARPHPDKLVESSPWHRLPRPSPAIGPISPRTYHHRRSFGCPTRKRDLCRRNPFRPSCRLLES